MNDDKTAEKIKQEMEDREKIYRVGRRRHRNVSLAISLSVTGGILLICGSIICFKAFLGYISGSFGIRSAYTTTSTITYEIIPTGSSIDENIETSVNTITDTTVPPETTADTIMTAHEVNTTTTTTETTTTEATTVEVTTTEATTTEATTTEATTTTVSTTESTITTESDFIYLQISQFDAATQDRYNKIAGLSLYEMYLDIGAAKKSGYNINKTIDWKSVKIFGDLPKPAFSNKGIILDNQSDLARIAIRGLTSEQIARYFKTFPNYGFTSGLQATDWLMISNPSTGMYFVMIFYPVDGVDYVFMEIGKP